MKLRKLRADMLFLLLAPAQVRLIVLAEKDLYALCVREDKAGETRKKGAIQAIGGWLPKSIQDGRERLTRAGQGRGYPGGFYPLAAFSMASTIL